MFNLHCLCATYKNMRSNNEDNYYFNSFYACKEHDSEEYESFITDENIKVFGVFDGLGGEERGEVASYIAAKTLSEVYDSNDVEEYYNTANEKICDVSLKKSSKISGTTAVIIDINNGYFKCSNIGDSRAYLLRGKAIRQLSIDHTSLQTLIMTGVITKEQAEKSKYKNVLSQCLGMMEDDIKISPYIGKYEDVCEGDIFLICSDGLTKLSDEAINSIVLGTDRKKVCKRLFEETVKAGSKDNVTIILIYVSKNKMVIENKSIFKKITQAFFGKN